MEGLIIFLGGKKEEFEVEFGARGLAGLLNYLLMVALFM